MRVLFVALLCASIARADPPALVPPPVISPLKAVPEASLSPLKLDSVDLDRIEHRARVRRNVGIGLAVPGVASIVLGAILIGIGVNGHGYVVTRADEIAVGAVSAGVGVVLTIPGALLWLTGQDAIDTAAWRRKRASP